MQQCRCVYTRENIHNFDLHAGSLAGVLALRRWLRTEERIKHGRGATAMRLIVWTIVSSCFMYQIARGVAWRAGMCSEQVHVCESAFKYSRNSKHYGICGFYGVTWDQLK